MTKRLTPVEPAQVLLRTDSEQVGLDVVFAFECDPGMWVVAKWALIPKLGADRVWFAHYWTGPVAPRWHGTANGQVPPDAALFDSLEAASAAYTGVDH